MNGVVLEHIQKRYGDVEIIRDFNLEIKDREFLVLVGPSGCGKSTVLRMIAGLEEISGGKLQIGDLLVNDVSPKDRNIAMVFQDYALYPHLSVRDNIAFCLKLQKASKSEIAQKVKDASEILGLEQLLDRKPKQLSGGQRQRVAIGRAIVRAPKVFLFDEPLSNLDAKLRVQMRVELSRLHKRLQTTMIYVTHDQIEAMTLADRIVVMKDGVIQQVGTPLELYKKPANAFVGGFIGSPVMNQISATAEGQNIAGDGFSIAVNEKILQNLGKQKDVLLGIRPEDICLCEEKDASFKACVEVLEPVGSESYIYFTLGQKQWIVRCDGIPSIKEDDVVFFSIAPEKLHIFSKDGLTRITT